MTSVGFCGEWFIFCCDTKLVAVHSKQDREPFVFDCSAAEKRPKNTKDDQSGDGDASEETGSDKVLAFAVAPSGTLLALTDDNKRLVLFRCEPSWRRISTRFVARRCTSLQFSHAEDELLAADKSGDVYSFSVVAPQAGGELRMGHLSMVLAVTLTPDDRYVITADRDEKIRVSRLASPYSIQSFCLGHRQFVSALLVPSDQRRWLLSGSGDGTLKLWDYESGRALQSWDLQELEGAKSAESDTQPTVCRISCSPGARHVAVQCERVSAVQFFAVDREAEERLAPHSRLPLPHCPLDVTFDPEGRLWVLMDAGDAPLQIYTHRGESWERDAASPDLNRVDEAFRTHWQTLDASSRTSTRFEHLYKVSFDNVAAYRQKKQQRLEEQQKKRTKAAQNGGGAKKARTPRR
ncbi:tRNA (guanine-N(7)-)-methyltransferase non-catalytic subunit wdr4 isoform X2 [Brachionichthys hirsutus]|uniref:tRNA (guanine-N(7)-)-methyltransferase non-catalytic subunit wdr4 isoform X2 n=1 Tax=Brachionichthys hirsutus TaxID=412623 RepID=UPI00360440BA